MYRLASALAAMALVLAACGGEDPAADTASEPESQEPPPALVIGGIPDQEVALLEERFDGVATYLSDEVGIPVRYQPSVDYAAVVTSFANGEVKLGWFGGLTGVQARLETEGAEAVLQRPIDAEFRSVFIANADFEADTIADLASSRFTFGSESSTSGHLMPRYFLQQDGVDPEADFDGQPGYSGSHDKTYKLVEAGSFEVGALNSSVWDQAVEDGAVDTDIVREVARTPTYFDYHWVVHPDIDEVYGDGTSDKLVEALMGMQDAGPAATDTLELFETDSFIPTENANYAQIEEVARSLDLIQ